MQHLTFRSHAGVARVVDVLNGLIEACKGAENGYRTSAADARDPVFRALFAHQSQQRAQFAAALERRVAHLGGSTPSRLRVVGALRRGWMDLRSALEGGSDPALLAVCDRGEEAALHDYDRALDGAIALPGDVRALLESQRAAIAQARDEVHRLRELPPGR